MIRFKDIHNEYLLMRAAELLSLHEMVLCA